MEDIQTSENSENTQPKKGRGQYERGNKKRGSYQKHKAEKKVTVTHFLNTKINFAKQESLPWDDEETNRFPIYVKVIFNKRTHIFRSLIEDLIQDEEEFELLLKDIDYQYTFQREKKFIEYYLTQTYYRYLAHHSDNEKWAIKNYHFDFSLNGYLYKDNEINKSIDYALKFEIYNFANQLITDELEQKEGESNSIDEIDNDNFKIIEETLEIRYRPIVEAVQNSTSNITALELLNFYELRDARFKSIRKKFSSEIWHFNIFYCLFVEDAYQYQVLGATIVDFIEGDFKEHFIFYCKEYKKEIELILADIETLRSRFAFI